MPSVILTVAHMILPTGRARALVAVVGVHGGLERLPRRPGAAALGATYELQTRLHVGLRGAW